MNLHGISKFLILTIAFSTNGICDSHSEAVSNWFSAADSIWSFDIESTVDWYNGESDLNVSIERRQRFQNGMWRSDTVARTFASADFADLSFRRPSGSELSYAFNQRAYLKLDPVANFGSRLTSNMAVSAVRSEQLVLAQQATHCVFEGQTFREILSERLTGSHQKGRTISFPVLDRYRKIRPLALNEIQVEFESGTRSPFPAQIRVMSRANPLLPSFDFVMNYTSHEGIFFPTLITHRVYEKGEVVSRIVVRSRVTCINCEMDPLIFDLVAPVGTAMFDEADQSNYIVGEDGERDYEAFSERLSTRRDYAPPATRRVFQIVTLCGCTILLVVIVFRVVKAYR